MTSKLFTLFGCCLIHLAIGSVYAESVLYPVVAERTGWSPSLLVGGFSATILALGVGAAVYRRVFRGVTTRLLLLAMALVYVLAEANAVATVANPEHWVTVDPDVVYVVFLVVKGLALGVLYAGAVLVASSLFTERVGLSTGAVVACFGLGSFVAARAYVFLLGGDQTSLVFFFIGKWALLVVGALCLRTRSLIQAGGQGSWYANRDWLLLSAAFFFNICVGISLISNLANATVALGFSFEDAAWLVAAAGVANSLGRLVLAALGDKLGVTLVLRLALVAQAVLLLLPQGLWFATVLGVVAVYGAVFALVPTVCKRRFDDGDSAYSALLVWWGLAGLVGPTLYSLAGDASILLISVFAVVALVSFSRFCRA